MKYIKPTISLLSIGTSSAAASTCSTSTADANNIIDVIESMGFDMELAFNSSMEGCSQIVPFEDYCKFSSSIQVFFS